MTCPTPPQLLRLTGGLALLLALSPLQAGCAAVTAGGFGGELTEKDRETAQIIEFDRDLDIVWARTKETLAHLSTREARFDDETYQAYATVDDGAVKAEVIETAPGHTRIYVKARKFGVSDDELARSVLNRIGREVER